MMKNFLAIVLAIAGIIIGFFGGQFYTNIKNPATMLAQVFPSPTPISTVAVVTQVRNLSRLETTQYTIEKVIVEDKKVGPMKVENLLLIAHGEVIAGVDLSELQDSDIRISNQTITIQLPSAQIFNVDNVVNDKLTYVFQRKGLPFLVDKDLETNARARASDEIIRASCESGILQTATDNAVSTVERLLTPLDMTVKVIPNTTLECPIPPVTPAP